MADAPFNRTPIYPLEKPLSVDVNQGFSQSDRTLRDTFFRLLGGASGFLRSGFQCQASGPPAMSVVLAAGTAFQDAPTDTPAAIGGVLGVDDLCRYKPIILSNDLTVAVPTAPVANSRIDLIEVRYNRQLDNSQSRQFLDPTTDAFSPAFQPKTLDFNVDATMAYYAAAATPTTAFAYKSGVVGASPAAPAVDTGYMPIAYITVGTGVLTIVAANIADARAMIAPAAYAGRQTFTANGTYTPTPGAVMALIRACGGGGGSGGIHCTAGNVAAAGAGASGVTVEKLMTAVSGQLTGGAVVIGAGGTAGPGGAGLLPGGDGGDTSAVVNGVTILAKGGAGSTAGADFGTQVSCAPGSKPLAGSANFDTFTAEHGEISVATATNQFAPGSGGSSPFGIGGAGKPGAPPTAEAATGHGAGGGGTTCVGAFDSAGAAGSGGIVQIDEWF